MEIRPIRPADLDRLIDIDGTIESSSYLHVDSSGEGLAMSWKLEERPLREKRMERNTPTDDMVFMMKQLVTGVNVMWLGGVTRATSPSASGMGVLLVCARRVRRTRDAIPPA